MKTADKSFTFEVYLLYQINYAYEKHSPEASTPLSKKNAFLIKIRPVDNHNNIIHVDHCS